MDQMVAISMVTSEQHDKVIDLLLARHRHQHERKHDTRSTLPIIRSLADIGRKGSDRRIEGISLLFSHLENSTKPNQR